MHYAVFFTVKKNKVAGRLFYSLFFLFFNVIGENPLKKKKERNSKNK